MQKLLESLRITCPELSFVASDTFYWSPETAEVFYKEPVLKHDEQACWSLLHETGHALMNHKSYTTDVELLRMEIEAWERARELGAQFDVVIDEDHMQDCLDTYRDWLNARALCPSCTTRCLQADSGREYRCHNCHTSWSVTASRFCRPYRSVNGSVQKQTIFALK